MAIFKRKRKPEWPPVRLLLERLEDRNLLAARHEPYFILDGDLMVRLDAANDVVTFQYVDAKTERLTIDGMNFAYARGTVRLLNIYGESGDDQIELASDVTARAWIHGDEGNDTLVGGAGDDMFFGGEGADLLIGGAGDDYLDGDVGNDTLDGGAGNDRLTGLDYMVISDDYNWWAIVPPPLGQTRDLIQGGDGNDVIAHYTADDTVDVGQGDDVIIGNLDGALDLRRWDEVINGNAINRYNIQVLICGDTSDEQTITLENLDTSTARLVVNGTSYEFERSSFSGRWDVALAHFGEGDGWFDVEFSDVTGRLVLTPEGSDLLHARFVPVTEDAPGAAFFYADIVDPYAYLELSHFTEPVLVEVRADYVNQIVYVRQISLEDENAGEKRVTGRFSYDDLGNFFVQMDAANDLVLDQSSANSGYFTDQSEIDDSLAGTLSGGDEDDTFWAAYGDNSLLAENGADTLAEGLGNDLLDSGLAKNYLDPGLG